MCVCVCVAFNVLKSGDEKLLHRILKEG